LREEFGDGAILARTLNAQCLTMMPGADEWDEYAAKHTDGINEMDVSNLERFWAATDVEVDGQGRILIPPLFRKYAELDGEVVVVKHKNRVEIWNKEIHESINIGENMTELIKIVRKQV